jgi:hypothetical protein
MNSIERVKAAIHFDNPDWVKNNPNDKNRYSLALNLANSLGDDKMNDYTCLR